MPVHPSRKVHNLYNEDFIFFLLPIDNLMFKQILTGETDINPEPSQLKILGFSVTKFQLFLICLTFKFQKYDFTYITCPRCNNLIHSHLVYPHPFYSSPL